MPGGFGSIAWWLYRIMGGKPPGGVCATIIIRPRVSADITIRPRVDVSGVTIRPRVSATIEINECD